MVLELQLELELVKEMLKPRSKPMPKCGIPLPIVLNASHDEQR